MIVEGQGIGFWTRVRLPSTPLKNAYFQAFETLSKMAVTARVTGTATHYYRKIFEGRNVWGVFFFFGDVAQLGEHLLDV